MNPGKSSRAFTLVELLIAMMVMALGFVSLQRLYTAALRDDVYALHLTEAVNVVRSRLEDMIASGCDAIQNGAQAAGGYSLTWSVSRDDPLVRCKTIVVTAQWREHGQLKQTSLERIFCE